ncbi:orotate phosphoribosyltransferase [Pelomicrobium sp.]|jgi:orotate phosphoribosyltransferase|uniref:orotate phosphoribosyltransferase n=1 Tax=Pelomicrobium sp. TaxID=2815319 RepID=UPI002FDCA96A
MTDFRRQFVEFAIARGALRFGEFRTKAGRVSPYFFNAGLFDDGASLGALAQFYAKAIRASGIAFDMLFGPAYKGIPLVTATAVALAGQGLNCPFCFDRKEPKDHGEGGATIGAPLRGRVLIVDDVISAGTSVRGAVELIRTAGAAPCGVVIALDRMERGLGSLSAAEEVRQAYGIPVISIATLDDMIAHLETQESLARHLHEIRRYRERYGARP